jgi:lipoprotein-releasing system permease protein
MMIYEKMADIAILKSIGFSDAEVATLFVIEALSIGVIGSLCGALLGLGLSLGISRIPFHLQGFITVEHLVINFDPLFYVAAFFLGTLSTSLAGLLPARRAARLDPVEIMRNKAV